MFSKEQIALKEINKVIGIWEKTKKKLESAVDSLKEVITQNKNRIHEINKQADITILELKNKNDVLLSNITQAEKFKNNMEKMFN